MMKDVTIVDYGIGNVLSVSRAFEYCGAQVKFAQSAKEISNANRIVVPGVGAFANCVSALTTSNLRDTVIDFAHSGKPYLGICVGMQMMLDLGEEFGKHSGLGLLPGKVTKISDKGKDGQHHKIPFIGWKPLKIVPQHNHKIFSNIDNREKVYFLHSYKAEPENDNDILASYNYDGIDIPAAIGKDNMIGTQFHPEKSGVMGLKIIDNFLSL